MALSCFTVFNLLFCASVNGQIISPPNLSDWPTVYEPEDTSPPIWSGEFHYRVKDLSSISSDECAYMGYTQVEIVILNEPDDASFQTTSFTVSAESNAALVPVAEVQLKNGYLRYPVEFNAGQCTNSLLLTFQ
jgi:hypothetical protein